MNYTEQAKAAIADWVASTGSYCCGRFFVRDYWQDGYVFFEMQPWTEGIGLGLIRSQPEFRRTGLGTRALKELLTFADKHRVPITGNVKPMKDTGGRWPLLDKRNLKAWYKRHGFTIKGDTIRRVPTSLIPSRPAP